MNDYLLATTGSAGDVYPFVALARGLMMRGHDVTLLAPEEFGPLIQRFGLRFAALEPEEGPPPERFLKRCMPWHCLQALVHATIRPMTRRWRKLARASTILPLLRPTYEMIAQRSVPRRTVVVASSPLLGARMAQEALGVSLATVHLSPAFLRSAYRSPVLPPLALPDWMPPWAKRASYRAVDALVLDPRLRQPIRALGAELHLPPVRRVLHHWRHSPQLVLGLFPSWFAPPQPDWPASVRQTGFLTFDAAESNGMSNDLCRFLDAGSPPVVVTAGSAIRRAHDFFRETAQACQQVGRRAILLTRYPQQVPADLPSEIRHFLYVPLSQLLPRSAALVHCGGIGTAASALSAGIPQLIMPLKNDQHENARRLLDLGSARVLSPRAYHAQTVSSALDQLLSPSASFAHHALASRLDADQALNETCEWIEQIDGPPASGAIAPASPREALHAALAAA